MIPDLPSSPDNMPPTPTVESVEPPAPVEVIEAEASGTGESQIGAPQLEDVSLAVVLGRLIIRPVTTLRGLGRAADRMAAQHPRRAAVPREGQDATLPDRVSAESQGSGSAPPSARGRQPRPANGGSNIRAMSRTITLEQSGPLNFAFSGPAIDGRGLPALGLMVFLWAVGTFAGAMILSRGRQRTDADLVPGLIFLLASGFAFAFVSLRMHSQAQLPRLIRGIWPAANESQPDQTADSAAMQRSGVSVWIAQNRLRIGFAIFGIVGMGFAYMLNSRNRFTDSGVLFWVLSVVALILAFRPASSATFTQWVERLGAFVLSLPGRVIAFRLSPTLFILVIILIVGGYFRFSNLEAYPPDMTSDHVEKARDSQFIVDGLRPVFLPNNGGREVAHFYFLALLKTVTGLPMDFDLLKIATGLEGMLGILAAYWLGRAFFRDEDKNLGEVVGLLMAAFIAVSYWQTMLSRLGLRIVLTPLVVSVLLVFFVRALRYNRRWDWIMTGLVLGIGVYCYQAVRMVPVFIVIGFILALIFRVRSWIAFRRYVINFIILVMLAVAIFVPMGRFMIESPAEFWSRTTGRLFGEDTIEIKDPQTGAVVSRVANTQDRMEAFQKNVGFFWSNLKKSVLMFNWYGDAAWVTGTPDASPEMDLLTGALLILGLGAWLVRMVKRRDPADWLLPFAVLVMLFPTALSLAFTIEVPSATRASGTLPMVYLIAAFGAALVLRQAWRVFHAPLLRVGVLAVMVAVIALMASQNYNTYFVTAMTEYRASTLPHGQAGKILKGFSDSTGAPGNAFMIAYPYWWDHRALAISAEDIYWNNGILQDNLKDRIIQAIRGNIGSRYEFQVDRQVLFFLNMADTASSETLKAWLPGLTITRVKAFAPNKDFLIAVAPAVGCQWYAENIPGVPTPDVCKKDQGTVP